MKNKVFITGGAQRIGKALVEHFHSIGWDVVFQYRSSKTEAEKIKESLNSIRPESCQIIACDFDNKESCANFYVQLEKNIHGLTGLINNASTFYPKKLSETSHDDWVKLTSSNLYQPIFISKICSIGLKSGSIGIELKPRVRISTPSTPKNLIFGFWNIKLLLTF